MTARPGDRLPRPATPAPWLLEWDDDIDRPWRIWGVCDLIEEYREDKSHVDHLRDCEAVAALPEWVAAHDAERARADRAEAALTELRATVQGWRAELAADGVLPDAVEALAAILGEFEDYGYGEAQ